jgi:hypothetical protein
VFFLHKLLYRCCFQPSENPIVVKNLSLSGLADNAGPGSGIAGRIRHPRQELVVGALIYSIRSPKVDAFDRAYGRGAVDDVGRAAPSWLPEISEELLLGRGAHSRGFGRPGPGRSFATPRWRVPCRCRTDGPHSVIALFQGTGDAVSAGALCRVDCGDAVTGYGGRAAMGRLPEISEDLLLGRGAHSSGFGRPGPGLGISFATPRWESSMPLSNRWLCRVS